MTTYAELYKERCQGDKPTFWVPQPLKQVVPCLFGDEDLKISPKWKVEAALQRCLALALQLELPVGEWVGACTNAEKTKFTKEQLDLLKSNIKDETFHLRGFQFAQQAFPISQEILDESVLIGEAWDELNAPTISKAGYAEMGVFMITLAILRLVGGPELANLSQKVAEDESRHVATNRGIMRDLGLAPASPEASIQRLMDETLEWVVGDLEVPGDDLCEDFDFNLSFLRESSRELVEDGIAHRLNALLDYQVHTLPFENDNRQMYSRMVLD